MRPAESHPDRRRSASSKARCPATARGRRGAGSDRPSRLEGEKKPPAGDDRPVIGQPATQRPDAGFEVSRVGVFHRKGSRTIDRAPIVSRDLHPRTTFDMHALSHRAPSAARLGRRPPGGKTAFRLSILPRPHANSAGNTHFPADRSRLRPFGPGPNMTSDAWFAHVTPRGRRERDGGHGLRRDVRIRLGNSVRL